MDESEEFMAKIREQQICDAYQWNRLIMFLSDLRGEGEELFSLTFTTNEKIKVEATSRPDCITLDND